MLRLTFEIGCLWLILSPLPCFAQGKSAGPFQVEIKTGLAYREGKVVDPVRHKLDLYLPKGKKDFPVLMFVHGGSWKSGNKDLYASFGKTFAAEGIGTVIINYRLSNNENKAKHPDHIQDVAAAFAWTYKTISTYGGNKDCIFVCGHSAGGHLVALLATDEQYLKQHQLSSRQIRGVIPISGVYEIRPELKVFSVPFGSENEVCKAASPLTHVKEKCPPFLVVYADKDFPTLDLMAETFHSKLKECKCDCSILKVAKRDHFTIIIYCAVDVEDPCTSAILKFIEKHSDWKRAKK